MRIGVMLRALDDRGGIGVYTRNLVQELLRIDDHNQYVLFYRDAGPVGRYARHANVTERVVRAPNKALWDQLAIPYACWREKVDILLHPKFTLPLLAPCKAVMVVHGADWFIPEQAQYYHPLDVWYIKTLMPWYVRKASTVISVSQLTTDNFNRALGLPAGKVRTIYSGPANHFRRMTDAAILRDVQARYGLPEPFILTLSKQGGGDRKNFAQIHRAYEIYHGRTPSPHKLVVGGDGCFQFRAEYGILDHGYGQDIHFPGWIDQADLPAVYSLADLFLYPSNLEAFPVPIIEAMACGTPIVTSDVNGLVEIAGDAALFMAPGDAGAIAEAISRALGDGDLRRELVARGLARVRNFNWEKCAREVLAMLEQLHEGGSRCE